MPITSKVYTTPFDKTLDKIYNLTMMEHPSEYDKVFKVRSAIKGPNETQAEMSGLGLPTEIGEGEGVLYTNPKDGNKITLEYQWSGNGYTITRQALDDELYGQLRGLPKALAKSMRVFADIKAFELFNSAETTSQLADSKDGKALCQNSGHVLLNPYDGVTAYHNIPTTSSGDLSETTFKQALEYYDGVVDEDGYPIKLDPSMLLCSIEDKYIAHRLHTQMYGGSSDAGGLGATLTTSGSVENAHMMNLSNPENGFVNGWTPFDSRWLSNDRWFLLSADHDAQFVWKTKPEQESEKEFDTGNTKYKALQRFGVWCPEYRGVFGNISGNTAT